MLHFDGKSFAKTTSVMLTSMNKLCTMFVIKVLGNEAIYGNKS